ncbi:MAG: hypothetical protein AAGU32_17960, partial [Bacillota bacterium]
MEKIHALHDKEINPNARGFKSLFSKILIFVGVPVILAFLTVSFVLLTIVDSTVTNLTEHELSARSQAAANDINAYFGKYYDITEQLSHNSAVQALFGELVRGVIIEDAEGLKPVMDTMKNIQAASGDSIMAV